MGEEGKAVVRREEKQELEERMRKAAVWGEEMLIQQPVAPNEETSLLAGQAVLSADIASSDLEEFAAAEQAMADAKQELAMADAKQEQAMADAKQELEEAKAAKEHEAKNDSSYLSP